MVALCDPGVSRNEFRYSDADVPIPAHFLDPSLGSVARYDNSPATNPVTNAGAALGRVLFYDVQLSRDNNISCASCHQQQFGFSDTLRASLGHKGQRTARRTMALGNARFNYRGRFFWDERAASLEDQVVQPIQDTLEMGMGLADVARKLSATSYYPRLFAAAFGSSSITTDAIAKALAQFVRAMVSGRSRYDAVFATGGAPDFSRLDPNEMEGLKLFSKTGCVNCHRSVVQFADKANNNGLDLIPSDSGSGGGRFKAPSLRNVSVHPPYMHDGRFHSLHEVVAFYDHGVRDTPLLDSRMRLENGEVERLNLAPNEIEALVAFLGALTDSTFLRDQRFANPFPCRRGSDGRAAE